MRVVLTGENARDLTPLRAQVIGLGLECDALDCVSVDNLRLRLNGGTPVDLVVVVVGQDEVAALSAVQQGRTAGAAVVAVTTDTGIRDQMRRAGAADFIEEQSFGAQLQTVVDTLYRAGAVRSRRGRLIAIPSAQPGVGVTTVSSGVAFALAAQHKSEVLLAELGTGTPELALGLNVTVRHGLEGLVRNYERSDAHMVRQVVTRYEPGKLNILACTPLLLHPPHLGEKIVRRLAVLLREMFGQIVLDLGHAATSGTVEAMRLADVVLVVARPDVPSVRLARAYLVELRDAGVPIDRIKVALNRCGHSGHVDTKSAKEVLSVVPEEWVPDDPNTVSVALEKGQPLIEYYPRARITRAMERLARVLAPVAT